MPGEDIAIRVQNVSKDFILPHERVQSVKGLFTGLAKGRIGKNREVQHTLTDISFEVRKGEFFGIVGRNGSGKSTLLKILAGIYQPTNGKVYTEGKLVPFIELGVGFNPELTGRENVYLNGAMLGFSEKEIDAMYDDIVAFAELERFMDQKLKNYSSGMQVRLAFSMATRSQADILLIDEVLAVGDADFQRKCFEYFKALKKNNKTVVFVSHDMDAMREYCDRSMLVESSEVMLIGDTNKVAEKYIKLFNEQTATEPAQLTQEEIRWGNGRANISKVVIKDHTNSIQINLTIKANEDIEAPVIGFRMRNAAGDDIAGTNTRIEQASPEWLKKGKTYEVEWSFPNVLSDGKYYVDPSVINPDGTTVYDWWNEAAIITIKKGRHIPYPMDPGFAVTIKS